MNLKSFFSAEYLLVNNISFLSLGDKNFAIFGTFFLLLSGFLKYSSVVALSPLDQKVRLGFCKLFFFFGLSEILWIGLRFQNVKFFGTRLIAWLIVLVSIVWLGILIRKLVQNYVKEKTEWEKEQIKLKYLPK